MKKTADYVNSMAQNTVPKEERLYQRLEREHNHQQHSMDSRLNAMTPKRARVPERRPGKEMPQIQIETELNVDYEDFNTHMSSHTVAANLQKLPSSTSVRGGSINIDIQNSSKRSKEQKSERAVGDRKFRHLTLNEWIHVVGKQVEEQDINGLKSVNAHGQKTYKI
jgi:hypothetical protein